MNAQRRLHLKTGYMSKAHVHPAHLKKVLLLGSGALKIGEAGEFDYSGSQAIKALKEENLEVIVINPNIATVQTSKGFADRVYFLPITPYFVERVIEKEKPQGILLGFGGQTALNCGLELAHRGVFKKHSVKVLGTQISAIRKTEDRELFNRELGKIGVKVPRSIPAKSTGAALAAAKKVRYPVIVRAAFALGGRGSGVASNEQELRKLAEMAFTHSPQILVEEYLAGWKEIEYEVVRDSNDNCITVCNMENFDPLGIHTGESIVVAPSQTLANSEYHKLRELSIKVIRHFGVVGECNIQFALDPKSEDYRVIEVNARLSRSSALASKATGYPLAFVAAKLALGIPLTEISNSITKKTMACFEPALDYVVVKIPRWDLQKFRGVSRSIGSEMKSVGEVMAIGRNFEEALQKAIRMLNIGMYGLVGNKLFFERLAHELSNPTDKRIFAVIHSLQNHTSVQKINSLTGIDCWFLHKLKNVVDVSAKLQQYIRKMQKMPKELLLRAKQLGFSDKQIAMLLGIGDELKVRNFRKKLGIDPVVKQIDTLAAEYPAETNYLYMTYNGIEDDVSFGNRKQAIVLGSGPYSIGSSVEFDWCCVNVVDALRKSGYGAIMVNFNPETVSTDYDTCDRLYFEELSLERVLDIYEKEMPLGIVISAGGQIPNNLATKLDSSGVRIMGTSAKNIDRAEDRHKFSSLCDSLSIDQPEWKELVSKKEALAFAKRAGYPVLVRPSYVLSGSSMLVAFTEKDLRDYLETATALSKEYPVVLSKFILNAKEIEIDAVADKGGLLAWAITEHVENAGVHSGDATMLLPPQRTYVETIRRVKDIARKIASALEITGPFNIQLIAKDNDVKVIECNLRASRSFPFVSKVFGHNFIELATQAMLGQSPKPLHESALELDHVGVKAPQFSFSRLRGADPLLGVEMASTGEVACLGSEFEDAFLKAQLATGMQIPHSSVLVSLSGEENRVKLLPDIKKLREHGFKIYATEHTAEFLRLHGIICMLVYKLHDRREPNVRTYVTKRKLDMAICIPDPEAKAVLDDEYELRRLAVDYSIPLVTNRQLAEAFIGAMLKKNLNDLEIKEWGEYF